MTGSAVVLRGDARRLPLGDSSVHCVVTSPPYYGLRDYGLPPAVWGGDPACEHEWQPHLTPAANGIVHAGGMVGETLSGHSATRKPRRSEFCTRCGAWRGCLGLEPTPELYVAHLVEVFREVWRVLRPDGTVWLNLGDSFASGKGTCHNSGGTLPGIFDGARSLGQSRTRAGAHPLDRGSAATLARSGLKPKDLIGIPWRVALALQADGWWLRSDIVWAKANPLPESVRDRPTKSHEYLFLLAKGPRYYYDAEAIKEPCASGPSDLRKMARGEERIGGKNKVLLDPLNKASALTNVGRQRAVGSPSGRSKRDVWTLGTYTYRGAHFATMPPALAEPCVLASTSERGCCPHCGAPWQRMVEAVRVLDPVRHTGRAAQGNGDRNDGAAPRRIAETRTVGWRATCRCGAGEPIPCVVLDPFGGSGTTAMVAERLGSRGVAVELNGDYCVQARERIAVDAARRAVPAGRGQGALPLVFDEFAVE